uniref:UVR domain-containing protein n=1 Tax=Alexandrium catenella TaxID=2925 RepID=A0A7S1WH13_ALECA
MAPRADEAEGAGVPDGEKEQRLPQNPAVLRAAVEIVKRKKADAIEKEEYEAAARFHQKLQELEVQLQATEGSCGAGEAAAGADTPDAAPRTGGDGHSARPRSLLATPNPFRTVELLRQSGYSRLQAYALLGLLYIAVFAVEMLLVYVGWQFMGRTAGGADDAGEEAFDEF